MKLRVKPRSLTMMDHGARWRQGSGVRAVSGSARGVPGECQGNGQLVRWLGDDECGAVGAPVDHWIVELL